MDKLKLAKAIVTFQNLILKRTNYRLELIRGDIIATQPMRYDTIDGGSLRKEFDKYEDYARYRTFELVADEIRGKYSPEELSCFCVAEAGVFEGDFAWIINDTLRECEMFLYDSFEGFDKNDVADEINFSFTKEKNLKSSYRFGTLGGSPEQRIETVKSKLKYKDKCHIRRGYFPNSAINEKEKRWVFVSLDMDLYNPMREGLFYFWPNLVEGGFIFVHDFNNEDFAGIKKAVSEAEEAFGRIHKVPISDQGGTIILSK